MQVKAWERLLANVGLPNVTSWNLSLYEGVSFTYRRLVRSLTNPCAVRSCGWLTSTTNRTVAR